MASLHDVEPFAKPPRDQDLDSRDIGASKAARRLHPEVAIRAQRRIIARGARPVYRCRYACTRDGCTVEVRELPGIYFTVTSNRAIRRIARARIARLVEVPSEAFDVELMKLPARNAD